MLFCILHIEDFYTWPLEIRIYLGASVGNISTKFISPSGHVMVLFIVLKSVK